MPLTYPPPAPTITGDITSIHNLLQAPPLIARRLRTLAEQRFIADALLTGRYQTEGGAVKYQQGEPMYTDRPPEQVRPGGNYPRSGVGYGPEQVAEVIKWGEDIPIFDESIKRQRMDPVNRAFTKLVNQMVKTVDGVAIAAIASQVTATRAATAVWTGSSAVILRDILLAKADVYGLGQGFDPDIVVVDDITYAYVASDDKVTNALMREKGESPVYTGQFPVIGGLTVLPTIAANVPFATSALVLDSAQLGGMADEELGGPGYTGALPGIETKTIRRERTDGYDLRARRITVPVIMEPTAAIRITGVRA